MSHKARGLGAQSPREVLGLPPRTKLSGRKESSVRGALSAQPLAPLGTATSSWRNHAWRAPPLVASVVAAPAALQDSFLGQIDKDGSGFVKHTSAAAIHPTGHALDVDVKPLPVRAMQVRQPTSVAAPPSFRRHEPGETKLPATSSRSLPSKLSWVGKKKGPVLPLAAKSSEIPMKAGELRRLVERASGRSLDRRTEEQRKSSASSGLRASQLGSQRSHLTRATGSDVSQFSDAVTVNIPGSMRETSDPPATNGLHWDALVEAIDAKPVFETQPLNDTKEGGRTLRVRSAEHVVMEAVAALEAPQRSDTLGSGGNNETKDTAKFTQDAKSTEDTKPDTRSATFTTATRVSTKSSPLKAVLGSPSVSKTGFAGVVGTLKRVVSTLGTVSNASGQEESGATVLSQSCFVAG